jgi:chemotaxis family two-component system sensor kinase Cph1
MRRKAEEISRNRSYTIDDLSKDELIEELRIHQIELELQNEELLESQIKLANSQNKYFDLYNFAPVGYLTLDKNGLILDVNLAGASLLGNERSNLINMAFIRCIVREYQYDFHHIINEVLEFGMRNSIELQLKKLNNESFYAYLEIINTQDTNGDLLESRITITNIDELKNKEKELKDYQDTLEEKVKERTEELAKSNSELANFAYIASHDLREPLRMITSFLQLLERRYKDQLDQDANDFIGYAVDGAKHLNEMITDLRDYSKLTSKEPVIIPVKLEKVLEYALINLIIPTEEHKAVITYDPLPTVNGDEKLLVMLFQNLIGNGIKYNDKKSPKIHISALKENNQYVISVKDNGIGIKPEYLERIFTIFQRLHGADEYNGTGIGLAIAQKIVHQHHGEIWAESEPGKGTTFYFSIPNQIETIN